MCPQTIKDAPRCDVLPDLSEQERQALEQAISDAGEVFVPVEVDEYGNVLDGRARREIADRLGIPYTTVVRPGLTESEKIAHVLRLNVARRHLSSGKKKELIRLLRRDGKSLAAIADVTGVSKSTVHRQLADAPGDGADIPNTIVGKTGRRYPTHPARPSIHAKTQSETQKALDLVGSISADELPDRPIDLRGLAKAVRKTESRKRDDALLAAYEPHQFDGALELDTVRCCDIHDLDLPPDSVDLFFCDPPYSENALPLYDALGGLAARALKPGGFLIAYVGNWHLPQVIETLGRHLLYHWVYVEYHPASEQRNWQHRNFGKQRLMLVLRRPGETTWQKWVRDALETPREKEHHEWQQSEAAARHYIPAYVPPGGLVVDPFSGGGTTSAVCKALGRHFLAFDVDPVAVATTLERLSKVEVEDPDDDGDDDPDGAPDSEAGDNPEGDGGTSGGGDGGPLHGEGQEASSSGEGGQGSTTRDSRRSSSSSRPATRTSTRVISPRSIAAGLPPSQLTASWDADESHVIVSRPGLDPITIAVEHKPLSNPTFMKRNGNEKTAHCYGVIGGLSQGCLRCLTGFPKSDMPCYSDASGRGGCYARTSRWVAQQHNQAKCHDIIANGIHNDCLKVRRPKDDDWRLDHLVPDWIGDQPMRWRVDCESADGSMSIALGLFQRWAAENASMRFVTISSDHFAPSDRMLDWTARLGNTFVCHTVSGWFHPTELESRFASVQRYIDHGIQTVIWVCTSPKWSNDEVMQRALELVPGTHIVEVPHSSGKTVHEFPLYDVNPLGHCQDQRRDMDGRLVQAVPDGDGFRYVVPLPDGALDEPNGGVRGKCLGCKVRCGETAVFGDAAPSGGGQQDSDDGDAHPGLPSVQKPVPAYDMRGPESPAGTSADDLAKSVEWVDTRTVPVDATPTLVDLFCGCGGMSHGFAMAGFRPVLGIDLDDQALHTHAWNMTDTRTLLAPIEDLSDDAILAALAGETVDVLVGGPPCQGFSTAGERRPDDPRNDLFRQFVRVAGVLRPHFVVMENVPGILSFEDGRVIEQLLSSLTDVGYPGGSVLTLNAAEYGVPQLRQRVLTIANRHGLANPYPMPLLSSEQFLTVADAIGDLTGLPQGAVPNHEWPVPGASVQDRIAAACHGGPLFDSFTGGCRRLWPDRPAFTMLANNGQPHIHPHEDRYSSVREMARLQGFPDHFAFWGNMQSTLRQVGNAVPPPLAQQVALALRPSLALVSNRSSADALQRATYQVSAEPLHRLMEALLAWRSRTGRHLGVSDLISTMVSQGLVKDTQALGASETGTRPFDCYLTGSAVEAISEISAGIGPVDGAVPHSSIVIDQAVRNFASGGRYDKVHLMWEGHRNMQMAA